MCFWGRIIGVFFLAPLVASATDSYLPAVGPVSLSFAQPPPPVSQLAWRLPLPSACIDVGADRKRADSTAQVPPASSEAGKSHTAVAAVTPPSASSITTNPRENSANTSASAGGRSSSATATANQDETGIRSQSPQPILQQGPPVSMGGNESQATAFALMKYFQPGHARGTTDVIVPVSVGFVPPTPTRTAPSSTATYLSP